MSEVEYVISEIVQFFAILATSEASGPLGHVTGQIYKNRVYNCYWQCYQTPKPIIPSPLLPTLVFNWNFPLVQIQQSTSNLFNPYSNPSMVPQSTYFCLPHFLHLSPAIRTHPFSSSRILFWSFRLILLSL